MLVKENLFDKSKVEIGRHIDENNGIVNISEPDKPHIVTDYTLCKNYSMIQFTNIKEVFRLRYVFFDENKNYIEGDVFVPGYEFSVQVPTNAHYVRFSFRNSDNLPVNLDRVFITYEKYDKDAMYIQAKDNLLEENKQYHRVGKFNQIKSF